jgi:hypothetical protein
VVVESEVKNGSESKNNNPDVKKEPTPLAFNAEYVDVAT